RHNQLAEETVVDVVLNQGVQVLNDSILATLLLNPVALYELAEAIQEQMPDVWVPLLIRQGQRLLQAAGLSVADLLRKGAREAVPAILDNRDSAVQLLAGLRDWCRSSESLNIATDVFEIGAVLGLQEGTHRMDALRILMGADHPLRSSPVFDKALDYVRAYLDASLEKEKETNDFLRGVPEIADALRAGKFQCRLFREDKFQARAFITHPRPGAEAQAVVGASRFALADLAQKIALNVHFTGRAAAPIQAWYQEHWDKAEDISPAIRAVIERHTRPYSPFDVYMK